MEQKNYKDSSLVDLQKFLTSKKREHMLLRFQKKAGEVKDLSLFKKVKKDIAQILTYINQYKHGVK